MENTYNKYLSKAMSYYYDDNTFIKYYNRVPSTRDVTFKYCLDYFMNRDYTLNILELGTSRSFTDGRFPGCMKNIISYWEPDALEKWDWSAGLFTKYMSDILLERNINYNLTTVDIDSNALFRCKIMTNNNKNINYINNSSENYLRNCLAESVDLLYLDTGDMDEFTANLHLREVKIIVERNILKKDGLILIDDVRNPANIFSQQNLGKSKYSIPYLLDNGYRCIIDEYQVIMQKI